MAGATVQERVVDAAAQLLREGGPEAVTTRAVAEAAGTQPPALYRHFGDKDGLLEAVAEHELARYVAGKAAQADEADPVAALRTAWRRHVAFGLDHPALFALLAEPRRAARSPAVAAGREVLRARVARIAQAGRLAVPVDRAVQLVHAAGTGAVLALAAVPEAARDGALADTLMDAVLAVVVTGAPAAGADAVGAAAVTLRAAAPELDALTPGERELLAEWLGRLA